MNEGDTVPVPRVGPKVPSHTPETRERGGYSGQELPVLAVRELPMIASRAPLEALAVGTWRHLKGPEYAWPRPAAGPSTVLRLGFGAFESGERCND